IAHREHLAAAMGEASITRGQVVAEPDADLGAPRSFDFALVDDPVEVRAPPLGAGAIRGEDRGATARDLAAHVVLAVLREKERGRPKVVPVERRSELSHDS